MNKAQLIRLTRGGGGTPLPPPVNVTPPSILAAGLEVGDTASVVPGTYTGSVEVVGYNWKRNGSSLVPPVTSIGYQWVEADLGATMAVDETVRNTGGTLTTPTAGVGPIVAGAAPPDPGAAYEGVHPTTMAKRAEVVSLMSDLWPGYEDQTLASDTTVTTSASLVSTLANLSRTDLSAWHRIRIAPGSWASDAALNGVDKNIYPEVLGHLFGSTWDRATAGGGVLIESFDRNDKVHVEGRWSIYGYRGLHLRSIRFSQEADLGTDASRDSCQHIVVTRNTTRIEAPVVRIEDCEIGTAWEFSDQTKYGVGVKQTGLCEQLDIINCRFKGYQTGISANGCRYLRVWDNDFQQAIADTCSTYVNAGAPTSDPRGMSDINSLFPDRGLSWRRNNTGRNHVNAGFCAAFHMDVGQNGTSSDRQDYLCLIEQEVFQQERPLAVRDFIRVRPTAIPTEGSTITVSGTVFTFRAAPAGAFEIQIGATLGTTCTNAGATIDAAMDVVRLSVVSSTYFELHFDKDALLTNTVSTSFASTLTKLRVAGGMQGYYDDDLLAAYRIDKVVINCMVAVMGTGSSLHNGETIYDRCHIVRVGHFAPSATVEASGFNYTQDDEVQASHVAAVGAPVVLHTIRNSVISGVVGSLSQGGYDEDGTYTNGTAVMLLDNNVYPKWSIAEGQTVVDLLNGPYTLDTEGKVKYEVDNTGTNDVSDFMAEMYDVLKVKDVTDRASIGITDPAVWV